MFWGLHPRDIPYTSWGIHQTLRACAHLHRNEKLLRMMGQSLGSPWVGQFGHQDSGETQWYVPTDETFFPSIAEEGHSTIQAGTATHNRADCWTSRSLWNLLHWISPRFLFPLDYRVCPIPYHSPPSGGGLVRPCKCFWGKDVFLFIVFCPLLEKWIVCKITQTSLCEVQTVPIHKVFSKTKNMRFFLFL